VFSLRVRAIAHISYRNSVLMSITTLYRSEPRWDRDFWFSPYDSLVSSILQQNFMPLGEGGPHERGEKEGHPLNKALFYRYWFV